MKRWISGVFAAIMLLMIAGCSPIEKQPHIVATTMPVYTFTSTLCKNTPLKVDQLVQENISCLHDYTLTVKHMKLLENADLVIISGGGLEDFIEDTLPKGKAVVDASDKIALHEAAEPHDHEDDHHHNMDPHYWLSIKHAKQMVHTICDGLKTAYPGFSRQFNENLTILDNTFEQLESYADETLSNLNSREIITFHDGFSYMAEEFELTILYAIEEESGSEASAKDLIDICNLVSERSLPSVFIEKNGNDRSANVIAKESGTKVYCLDMAMSNGNYFEAMYYNIDTLKEALG